MERDDVKKLAWSIGIAWFVMAIGKLIYRYPKGYFVFFGVMLIYNMLEDGESAERTVQVAVSAFFIWGLVNIIVMAGYAIYDNIRPFSTIATVGGVFCFSTLTEAVADTHGVLEHMCTGGIAFIVGLLVVMAIIRHHIEIEGTSDSVAGWGYGYTAGFALFVILMIASLWLGAAKPHIEASVAAPSSLGAVAATQAEIDSAERMEITVPIYRQGKAHVMEALKQCFGATISPDRTSWRIDSDSLITLDGPSQWCTFDIATKQTQIHDF